MSLGPEEKKKLAAGGLGLFAVLAAGYMYVTYFGGPSTPPPQPAPVVVTKAPPVQMGIPPTKVVAAAPGSPAGTAAVKVATVGGQLDPTLHMDGMLAAEAMEYNGTGRNIFAPGAMQAPPVKMVAASFSGRGPIGPAVPQGPALPPPPPPINLKFFGVATQKGVKRALLLSGDDVFLASAGDIVQRRYKIVTIAANSITVEDMPNSNKQSLPLVAN